MAGDLERPVAGEKRSSEFRERLVLRLGERHVVGAFELNADGEVVATAAALPARDSRVPGAHLAGHVLNERAIPPY